MSYRIIGTRTVGSTLAALFASAGIEVSIANSRGVDTVRPIARELGQRRQNTGERHRGCGLQSRRRGLEGSRSDSQEP